MRFDKAYKLLLKGNRIKRRDTKQLWLYDKDKDIIKVYGASEDIFTIEDHKWLFTLVPVYLSKGWVIVDDMGDIISSKPMLYSTALKKITNIKKLIKSFRNIISGGDIDEL